MILFKIEASDFDPDIDGDISPSTDEKPNEVMIQGTLPPTTEVPDPENDNSLNPGIPTQQLISQETDWPDAIPMQIPRVSSLTVQPEEQRHNRSQAQHNIENFEIPELEENSEEEQFVDLDLYMAHHNTCQASEHIRQEYRSHLHELDDNQYYAEINKAYYPQEIPAAQDYQLANQEAAPQRSTEELKRLFGRGRGQARQEELHGHRPFGSRTHSLQSHIQCKIKKNQRLCQRYANNC